MTALSVAQSYLGTKEKGHNRGLLADNCNEYTGAAMGSPWCAGFLSLCFCRAAGPLHGLCPKSASSLGIRNWFEARQLLSWDPQDMANWKGAVAGWTNDDGHGHVFFVAKRLTNPSGKIVAIETVEGNSGPDGGRDGDGVYAHRRIVPVTAEGHKLWFCNTSHLPGGDFGWK